MFELIKKVKEINPLVLHYTNNVTMTDCANTTLAIGASPLMSLSYEEVDDIVKASSAVVINIGTMNSEMLDLFVLAGKAANKYNKPVILDPVGVFATKARTELTNKLLNEVKFDVIRGNISEIKFLGGLDVKGKGGHGSQPENCIDAVVVSSAIVMNLQTLVSRETRPHNPLVLSIGLLNSGTKLNVIAEEGHMEGTTRCFDPELRKQLPIKMERIIKSTAEAFGATATLRYDLAGSAVINDEQCSEIGQGSVEKILGKEGNYQFEKVTGGEDFCHYLDKVPGVLAFVGCKNDEKNCCYAHHNGRFAIDEDSLEIGTALYAQYAIDFLNK